MCRMGTQVCNKGPQLSEKGPWFKEKFAKRGLRFAKASSLAVYTGCCGRAPIPRCCTWELESLPSASWRAGRWGGSAVLLARW